MAKADIPVLVKHCALAILRSGDMAGTRMEQLRGAFLVARSRLVEYGYLASGSQKGGSKNIKLTAKGHQREAKHRRERFGYVKTIIWDLLYTLIQEDVEDDVPEAATAVDDQASSRDVIIEKKRRRLAKVAWSASPKRKPKRPKRAKRG